MALIHGQRDRQRKRTSWKSVRVNRNFIAGQTEGSERKEREGGGG